MATLEGIAAQAFNTMFFPYMLEFWRESSPLAYMLTGMNKPMYNPEDNTFKSRQMRKVNGTEMEIQYSLDLPTIGTLSSESDDVGLIQPNWDGDTVKSSTFELTLFHHNVTISKSRVDKVAGDAIKIKGEVEHQMNRLKEATVHTLSDHFWSSQTQSRATLAGIPHIVSASSNYLADRSLPKYSKLRSYVATGVTWSLDAFHTPITKVRNKQGRVDTIILGETKFNAFQSLVDNEIQINQGSDRWTQYSHDAYRYGAYANVVCDPKCGALDAYFLDSGCFVLDHNYSGVPSFQEEAMLNYALLGKLTFWMGLGCDAPQKQAKLTFGS